MTNRIETLSGTMWRTAAHCGVLVLWLFGGDPDCHARGDGFLVDGSTRIFPIGSYEFPKDDGALQAMADAGINLVRCGNAEDLDRAASAGMRGIMPLPLHNGPADSLKERVNAVKNHPALAVWEGPDEIVWNFTAFSRLYLTEGIHKVPGAWWKQTDNAVKYAEEQAAVIIPNMLESIRWIRENDPRGRPVWINEALQSDLGYVRRYLDAIDITGCDIYPVKADDRRVERIATAVERWKRVGMGKPVWMVLQAFAWSELGDYYGIEQTAYPTFNESRFMAYDSIARGARGILYWGSAYLKSDAFRESWYALTREIAMLQPFLTAPEVEGIGVNVIPGDVDESDGGAAASVRRHGRDWLVIVVNEHNEPHMAVEVTGLDWLNGAEMHCLYEDSKTQIRHGVLTARMLPYQVRVFCTSRSWETADLEGRDFEG